MFNKNGDRIAALQLEVDSLESLVEVKEKIIQKLESIDKTPVYVLVSAPSAENQTEYWRMISQFVDNDFCLFYFTQLQRSLTDEFLACDDPKKSDYFRGKMACIREIIQDSRKARTEFAKATAKNEA